MIIYLLYYYETKIEINISNDIINLLKQKIVEKKQEIENIKKIHWKWALSNDIEKEFIQEYVKNQI